MNRPGSATCKHIATRLPSPTPACVCSDSLSGTRVLHPRATCPGINEVQQRARPASHTLIKSARREQPHLNYVQYMRRSKDERSVSLLAGWIRICQLAFVAAPSTECGQPRHAWSDHVEISKSREKSIRLSECGRAGRNVCICATAIERTDKVLRTLRRAEQEADAWAANGEPTQVSVGQAHVPRLKQCTYRTAKAAPCMCPRHADGDKQRDSTNFWSFIVLQHSRRQSSSI